MKKRLNAREANIVAALGTAHAEFAALPNVGKDDLREFELAVHQAQCLVALRVARRVDPDFWRQPR